jgi:hypothetical protein
MGRRCRSLDIILFTISDGVIDILEKLTYLEIFLHLLFGFTLLVISSLFDDVKHKILSPLSYLREFDNHWMLEFDLPRVNKKDIKILFDRNMPCD